MDITKYKTHIINKLNIIKTNGAYIIIRTLPSIKHVTSNKYIHALHWAILHKEYNLTILQIGKKYTSMAIMWH